MADGATTKIDFFDFDHTIIRGSSAPLFLTMGVRRGLFPPISLAYIPFFFLQFYIGALNTGSRRWYFSLLEGKSRSSFEELSQAALDKLKSMTYPQARSLIARLKREGHSVVLATSSLDIIVNPLARHLGIDEVIASALEFEADRCTGRLVDGPLLKERKREKVLEYLQGKAVDWGDCSFYSDSIYDISLLESVGNPVAVNPDPRLRRVAKKRGWPILRFS